MFCRKIGVPAFFYENELVQEHLVVGGRLVPEKRAPHCGQRLSLNFAEDPKQFLTSLAQDILLRDLERGNRFAIFERLLLADTLIFSKRGATAIQRSSKLRVQLGAQKFYDRGPRQQANGQVFLSLG